MQTSAATQRVSESQPDWRALHRVYFKKPIQYDDAGWTERLHGRFEVPWEQPLFRDHQGTLTLIRYFPAGRHNFVRPYNIVVRLGDSFIDLRSAISCDFTKEQYVERDCIIVQEVP